MARIVIVEDDEIVAEIATEALTGAGHMVSAIYDGREAVEAICESDPDLVILDYNLPGETGLEILRRLRRMRFADTMPALMLTSRGGRLFKARAEQTGIDDYMEKPFDPADLVDRVEALLVGRSIAQAT